MTLPEYRKALAKEIRRARNAPVTYIRAGRLFALRFAARLCPDVDGRPSAPVETVTVSAADPFGADYTLNYEVLDSKGNRRKRRGV